MKAGGRSSMLSIFCRSAFLSFCSIPGNRFSGCRLPVLENRRPWTCRRKQTMLMELRGKLKTENCPSHLCGGLVVVYLADLHSSDTAIAARQTDRLFP